LCSQDFASATFVKALLEKIIAFLKKAAGTGISSSNFLDNGTTVETRKHAIIQCYKEPILCCMGSYYLI